MTGVWRPPTGSKRVKDKQIVKWTMLNLAQRSNSTSRMKFPDFPRLCRKILPDTSDTTTMVLGNF